MKALAASKEVDATIIEHTLGSDTVYEQRTLIEGTVEPTVAFSGVVRKRWIVAWAAQGLTRFRAWMAPKTTRFSPRRALKRAMARVPRSAVGFGWYDAPEPGSAPALFWLALDDLHASVPRSLLVSAFRSAVGEAAKPHNMVGALNALGDRACAYKDVACMKSPLDDLGKLMARLEGTPDNSSTKAQTE
ncbi:MAG: hypothetical protein ACI9OJ_003368, partial [Myxococcota bacterium]